MATTRTTSISALLVAVSSLAFAAPRSPEPPRRVVGAAAAAPDSRGWSLKRLEDVRAVEIPYLSHTGVVRRATIVLPAWYGPGNNPPLPVVVSPHGRGATGRSNAMFFGRLPALGRFAVISPDGMRNRLRNFSYGARGQIDDLARMPELSVSALPWLRLDSSRVYALGSSMGGQETLLLVARHPGLLAGAAALDSVTDLARRHRQLPGLRCSSTCLARWGKPYGAVLQSTLEREVGGSPDELARAYAARSGLSHAQAIASSGVPLQLWWSTQDRIVSDQKHQSEALFDALRGADACAPVSAYIGDWAHSKEMRANALLPIVLAGFGLLPREAKSLPASVQLHRAPACALARGMSAT